MKALILALLAATSAFCVGWVTGAEYKVRETLRFNIVCTPSSTLKSPPVTVLPDVKIPGLEMKGNTLVEGHVSNHK
jgi:hypothetical protein